MPGVRGATRAPAPHRRVGGRIPPCAAQAPAAFTVVFLRHRNVWPLGICHGLLGVVFYSWVLGRDPWWEML